MWGLQAYDEDNDRWVTIFENADDYVVLDEYEKMRSSPEARTGLRVLDSGSRTSRLCHA